MGMRGGGRERREFVAEVQKLEKAAADDPIQIARQEAIFERRKERGMERRRRERRVWLAIRRLFGKRSI
jgi:hypothetical protein